MECTGTSRFQLHPLEERIAPSLGSMLGADLHLGVSADADVSSNSSFGSDDLGGSSHTSASVSADVSADVSASSNGSLLGGLL